MIKQRFYISLYLVTVYSHGREVLLLGVKIGYLDGQKRKTLKTQHYSMSNKAGRQGAVPATAHNKKPTFLGRLFVM